MSVVNLKKRKQMNILSQEIKHENRLDLAEKVSAVLSSTYVLYHKTQDLHWNVEGPLFISVHNLTESQYSDLAAAIDDLAERVRALGAKVPVGLGRYASNAAIKDEPLDSDVQSALKQLADDHSKIADEMRGVVAHADEMNDVYTADLLTSRIGVHEEAAWMLNATAQK